MALHSIPRTPSNTPAAGAGGTRPAPHEAETVVAPVAAAVGVGAVVADKWLLTRLLGEGEFGAVFEARHTLIEGRLAALKILHPHKAIDPAHVRRFINEASAASCANHENIVLVFDGEARPGGLCYLAMELLRGSSLRARIGLGRIAVDRALGIGAQLASALDAAHRIRVVHRDLKPDNVMLCDRAGRPDFVKLFDFGIARLRDGGPVESKTRSGVLLGTPAYMAPEQWLSVPDIDGRADIYALGIVLFEALSGAPPFRGNVYELMQAHVEAPLPPLPHLGPKTAALDALLRRMTAKRREDRPAEAREVAAALRAIATGISSPTMRVGPDAATWVAMAASPPAAGARAIAPLPKRRSPRWLLYAGGAGVALLLGIGLRLLVSGWQHGDRPATVDRPDASVRLEAPSIPPPREAPVPAEVESSAEQGTAPPPPPPRKARTTPSLLTISGANEAQKKVIRTCLATDRLPASFDIVLERRGARLAIEGLRTAALDTCLRESFSRQPMPEFVLIRRRPANRP